VCPSNSKQLSHNQTVLMTSHYFDFDAVTHSIKDVSVSTLLPNCSESMGKSRINRCQELEPDSCRAPLRVNPFCVQEGAPRNSLVVANHGLTRCQPQ